MPTTPAGPNFIPNPVTSPGVFTREIDASGLAQGISNIGAVVVAPFPKGAAFSPTYITSVADLEAKFGVADGVYYGPYTAKQYLLEQGNVTITRVGALTGYKQNSPLMIYAVPGTWTRSPLAISASNTSFLETAAGITDPNQFMTYVTASSTGSLTLTSSILINFTSSQANTTSSFLGTTVLIGSVQTIFTGTTQIYITSSLQGSTASFTQKLAQALAESTLTTSSLSMSYSGNLLITASSAFGVTGNLYLVNPTFTALRAAGGCGTVIYLTSGQVSGSFGSYNGNFTPAGTIGSDPCTQANSGSQPIILAVLADTQNATIASDTLATNGFSASVLSMLTGSTSDNATTNNFSLLLKYTTVAGVTGSYGTYNFSMDPSSTQYITSVFGNNPTAGNPATQVSGQKIEAAYIYKIFSDSISAVISNRPGWKIQAGTEIAQETWSAGSASATTIQSRVGDVLNFTDTYSFTPAIGDSSFGITNAFTPWINSQRISSWTGSSGAASSTRFPLFRLHTRADGTGENTRYKIEISNVKLAGTVSGTNWGTFTLSVRDFNDTPKRPVFLETYQNLTLDPTSANFIARRIGDRYNFILFSGKITEFGTYKNISKLIRVEMTTNNYPVSAVPYGFSAYSTPIDSNYSTFVPRMYYTKASTYASDPGRYASGTVFGPVPVGADATLSALYPTSSTSVGVNNNTNQYFAPLPAFGSATSIGSNVVFDLEIDLSDAGVTAGNSIPSYVTSLEATYVPMRKFVLGFQGGFDGQSPAIPINVGSNIIAGNTQGLNCTTITSAGSIAYSQCIGALSNADEWDFNLIVTPGILSSMHSYVTNLVVSMCESRGDALYIMDNVVFPASNQSVGLVAAAVNEAANYDTSYACTYYPWVKILDANINQYVSVPPSVVLPAVFAASDKVGAEWFAPAGLNRGGITAAIQTLDRVTHAERDTLYDGKVNPIAAFPGQGINVWGQKTLQNANTALNRINVRRLMINLKKFIASTSRFLVFEQNVAVTRNRFLAIVNPYMQSVQQRSGLYAFQVIMDETTNTPDLIDQGILYGKVAIQPARSAEFILIDFILQPTGASFTGA